METNVLDPVVEKKRNENIETFTDSKGKASKHVYEKKAFDVIFLYDKSAVVALQHCRES